MSDSQIQPKIYYTVGAPFSGVISENGILKVVEGEIEFIDEQQRTVMLRLDTTNIRKTVNIENIKVAVLGAGAFSNAQIVSKFQKDANGGYTIPNLVDLLNFPPPQLSHLPETPVVRSLESSLANPDVEYYLIDGNDIIFSLDPFIRIGHFYQAPTTIRSFKKDLELSSPACILIDLTSTQE
ncbi:hypothetical protein [Pseudomonas sp. BW7P1]|uniref:hypothetical protein n=1 Tax=Pseudomonas TaxID=286 RepID=UPI0021AD7265|nr:hypothetical protein [Pseudomonas sp. BW7P1]UWI61575.1 hypothetical protein NWV16_26445 [Pseudomonas sp. BW7P1]